MPAMTVAVNTFRETVRNKILYVILAFALMVIGLTWFLADLSIGELSRIIADFGLAAIQIFGVTIAIFLGITLVSREVERKTVYLILSKPVSRWEFVVGKVAGLGMTLAMTTLLMALMLFLLYASYGYDGGFEVGLLIASFGLYMEVLLLVCLASFFSTFTTPILSALFTMSMFFIGHVSKSIYQFGGQSDQPFVRRLSEVIYYLLPNLEIFNWKNEVVYGGVSDISIVLPAVGYLLAYGGAVLVAACLIFSRKDLK